MSQDYLILEIFFLGKVIYLMKQGYIPFNIHY